MSDTQPQGKDFRRLRGSDRRSGMSLAIGIGFVVSRDAIARGLARVGVTPNMLTAGGLLVTAAVGACFALGAGHAPTWEHPPLGVPQSHWPLIAAALIYLASAMDMLDGALARVGNMRTRFGAVFDSITDRCSDVLLSLGCAVYFAARGNVTYVVLSISALAAAVMISYVKARAENLIEDCSVGYWQRGERVAAFLITAAVGHVPAALWQLGLLPWLTALRRVRYVRAVLTGGDRPGKPGGPLRYLLPWRHPRGSIGYDLVTGANIAFLIIGPWLWPVFYGLTDPMGDLLSALPGWAG